jgi:hypothetical protein
MVMNTEGNSTTAWNIIKALGRNHLNLIAIAMKGNIKKIKSMVTDNLPGRQEANTEDFILMI